MCNNPNLRNNFVNGFARESERVTSAYPQTPESAEEKEKEVRKWFT